MYTKEQLAQIESMAQMFGGIGSPKFNQALTLQVKETLLSVISETVTMGVSVGLGKRGLHSVAKAILSLPLQGRTDDPENKGKFEQTVSKEVAVLVQNTIDDYYAQKVQQTQEKEVGGVAATAN